MTQLRAMHNQLESMRDRGLAIRGELEKLRFTARSRDQLAQVSVNGLGRVVDLQLDLSATRPENLRRLSSAILSAAEDARQQAAATSSERLSEVFGDVVKDVQGTSELT